MNPAAILICRSLQAGGREDNISKNSKFFPPTATAEPTLQPINGSSSDDLRKPFSSTPRLDSSLALTAVILVAAFFCIGFISMYIRRFAYSSSAAAAAPPPPQDPKGGLDPSAVGSLPLVAYGGGVAAEMTDDCPICLTEFEERETVKLIPHCGHVFHATCIDTWLSSHVTCPLCRSAQLFKASADEEGEGLPGCDAAATQV